MKRLGALPVLAALLMLAAPAQAQESRMINPDCTIICSPVFVMQHGIIITDFIDAPTGADSNVEFLARFTTAFGTQFNPLFFAFLIQWTPFASKEPEGRANTPVLVYGPGFHVLGGASALMPIGGMAPYVALDLLPLMVYGPSAEEPSDFTHKLALEADLFIQVGRLIDPNNRAPYIHGSNIYAILDYLTDAFGTFIPDGTPSDLEASRWVLLIGATLPLAPIPGG